MEQKHLMRKLPDWLQQDEALAAIFEKPSIFTNEYQLIAPSTRQNETNDTRI